MQRKPLVVAAGMACLAWFAAGVANAQCVLPYQLTNGQMADASQVMADLNAVLDCLAPGGSANAVQYKNGSGGFGGLGPLTDGQLVVGSTGNAPQAATLTGGSGITVTNGPGNVTIAVTGGGSGGVDWLNYSAVVQPNLSSFTLRTSTTAPTGVSLSATSRGIMLSSTTSTNNTTMMAEVPVPSGTWKATMLSVYTGPLSKYVLPSITVRDAVNFKSVQFGLGASGTGGWRFDYQKTSGGIGLDSYYSDTPVIDVGLPPPTEPVWSRLAYDGTNLSWSFSRDGEHFSTAFVIAASNYLTNLSTIGPSVICEQPNGTTWPSYFHILSWNLVSP